MGTTSNSNNNNMNQKREITINKLINLYKCYVLNDHHYRKTLFLTTLMTLYPLFFILCNYFLGSAPIFPAIFTPKCDKVDINWNLEIGKFATTSPVKCKIGYFSLNETTGIQYIYLSVALHILILVSFLALSFLTAIAIFFANLAKSGILYLYKMISKKNKQVNYLCGLFFLSYCLTAILFRKPEIFWIGGNRYYSLFNFLDEKHFGYFAGCLLFIYFSVALTCLIDFILLLFITTVSIIYKDFLKYLISNFRSLLDNIKSELEKFEENN